jgi:hypothetical protein
MPKGPWELDGLDFKHRSSTELVEIVRYLLEAETSRCAMQADKVITGADKDTRDKGCDAFSPENNADGLPFVPEVETCWQLKAGGSSSKQKLINGKESAKEIPKQVLENGGAYKLIASGSANGETGERDRVQALKEVAEAEGIPSEKIYVMGAENLAKWCSKYPSIVKRYSNIPVSLLSAEEWFGDERFEDDYFEIGSLEAARKAVAERIKTFDQSSFHTHIFGYAGVGKTRLALEACRLSGESPLVVYCPSADMTSIQTFLEALRANELMRSILVVDECSRSDIDTLIKRVSSLRDRVHLLTIGREVPLENPATEMVQLPPLDRDGMEEYLKATYPSMPHEHRSVIHQYAEGYIKFARLIAEALLIEKHKEVTEILSAGEAAGFIEQLLEAVDPEAKKYILGVSLFNSVGMYGDKAEEGRIVSEFFGWDFGEMRMAIESVHKKHGIAPRAGDIVYLSPKPFTVILAIRAMSLHQDRILENAGVFEQNQSLNNAFLNRLKEIATAPSAKPVCDAFLGDFLALSDFNNPAKVRVWRQLNVADPYTAAHNLRKVLDETTIEDIQTVQGDARRDLVWGLEALVRTPEAYEDAITALAHLAVAENETWSNNATGNFNQHHQVYLSGTTLPYLDRISILKNIASLGPVYRKLAIHAVSSVANGSYTGSWSGDNNGPRVVEKDWQPATNKEKEDCVHAALALINESIEMGDTTYCHEITESLDRIFSNLYRTYLYPDVFEVIKRYAETYPDQRELFRQHVQGLMRGGRVRGEHGTEGFKRLQEVHALLTGDELTERVRALVGPWDMDIEEDEKLEVEKLAQEFVENPEVLSQHFSWLISGTANNIWDFARKLGELDGDQALLKELWDSRDQSVKKDVRLLMGYLEGQTKIFGEEWLVDLLNSLDIKNESDAECLLQAVWRLLPDSNGAKFILALLKGSAIKPTTYGHLLYGRWLSNIDRDSVLAVISALSSSEDSKVIAMSMMAQQLKDNKSLVEDADFRNLALQLVTDEDLITEKKSSHVYDWEHLAESLLESDMRVVLESIFDAHDTKKGWFVRHSRSEEILHKCAEVNPDLVWEVVSDKLVNAKNNVLFAIGFSSGLLEKLPHEKILKWCEEDPEERASLIGRLIGADFSNDESLFSKIMHRYGSNKSVLSSLSGGLFNVSWSGSESAMWGGMIERLKSAAESSEIPELKKWALAQIAYIQSRMEDAQRREAEEKIRGYRG